MLERTKLRVVQVREMSRSLCNSPMTSRDDVKESVCMAEKVHPQEKGKHLIIHFWKDDECVGQILLYELYMKTKKNSLIKL